MSRETGTLWPEIILCDPDGVVDANSWDVRNAQITAHQLTKTGTYTIIPTGNSLDTGDYDESNVSLLDPHLTFDVWSNAGRVVEVLRYTFTGDEPSGLYETGGRFLNDLTGRELSVDVEPFNFTR